MCVCICKMKTRIPRKTKKKILYVYIYHETEQVKRCNWSKHYKLAKKKMNNETADWSNVCFTLYFVRN